MARNSFWNGFGIALFSVVAILSVFLTLITYHSGHATSYAPWRQALIAYHFPIMLFTIFLVMLYGFVWARVLQSQVTSQIKTSTELLDLVVSFLGDDEREALKLLVAKDGQTTQADIGRLPGMGGVKALRVVKKLESRNLVSVTAHGKVRRVCLRKDLTALFSETSSSSSK